MSQQSVWNIDTAHSLVEFSVRHMMLAKVKGTFGRFQGKLTLEGDSLVPVAAEVSIETGSIDTGVEDRDKHLRSGDFFDSERFPTMTFVSKRVEGVSNENFRLVGDLTIRGVTKEVVLEAETVGRQKDPWGNERVGYSAKTRIDRKEFGLTWNQALEAGGIVVGDRVDISLEVEAVLAK